MKSERFNNFLLKINRKFVWHTAYLYRINYIIYGFSDYISKYIKSMKIFVTFYIFENLFINTICDISVLIYKINPDIYNTYNFLVQFLSNIKNMKSERFNNFSIDIKYMDINFL